MNTINSTVLLTVILLFSSPLYAQIDTGDTGSGSTTLLSASLSAENTQLALSSSDYRVTAGDVYTLSYMVSVGVGVNASTNAITYRITVDNSYRVRVSNLGTVNASGKTYQQLKTEVEALVNNNYPLSGVQMVLTQPASFKVTVAGEVQSAQEKASWALARLSSVLEGNLTRYSSIRDVQVVSSGGTARTYDLFRAQRDGEMGQNPYLRPGDTVRVGRADRIVTVEGEVERPGTYQLLSGEQLKELIEKYGGGYTQIADASRIELVRYVGSDYEYGEKLFITGAEVSGGYELKDIDVIRIPSRKELMPVMFVEGAVTSGGATTVQAQANASNRVSVQFNAGENYASLVQRNRLWFSAISDTQNAYLLRGEERIAMNLNPMLYDSGYRSEYYVEENDTLIIPFRQYFVTVAGAVISPGRYPYIPDRSWEYYIGLAGGFNPIANSREVIKIREISGRELRKGDAITPETTITAEANSFLYHFNQIAPVVTTILSIISTTISLLLLFK
ncbi:hypothetical protein FACS1894151_01770 [Spirochaetia bacterium]|nr:hypothetical protein FACS1894151_01770 [Spirochaetia bacterium]